MVALAAVQQMAAGEVAETAADRPEATAPAVAPVLAAITMAALAAVQRVPRQATRGPVVVAVLAVARLLRQPLAVPAALAATAFNLVVEVAVVALTVGLARL